MRSGIVGKKCFRKTARQQDSKAPQPQTSQRLAALSAEFGDEAIRPLDEEIIDIRYPVLEYPTKITSHNFDKKPVVEGTLLGIKGQYLIFDSGVINIREFTGYEVEAAA